MVGPTSLPRELFDSINVEGTRNLIGTLERSPNLRRFVHISTVAVVGDTNPKDPADEQSPCNPLDNYGASKLLAEKIVLDAASKGFPAVIVRPMWIYGPTSLVTRNLFHKIARRKLPMIGKGRNTMQPVALADTVEAIVRCALTPGIDGRIYNIAGPEILTVRSMCKAIARAMNAALPTLTIPMSLALPLARVSELLLPFVGVDPPLTMKKLEFFRVNNSYSIERARMELGWIPRKTFDQGAQEIAQAMRLMPQP
jgi:nucleoside-diphosphate-sugar epimerase